MPRLNVHSGKRGQPRTIKAGADLRHLTSAPPPPDYLGPEGQASWESACEILIDREDLTEGDLGVIEVYAANHQTFKECCRTLAAEGLIVENSRGSMSAHPAVTVRKQAETQLALAAMQLGFSPKSRRDMKVAAADSTPHQDKAVGSF